MVGHLLIVSPDCAFRADLSASLGRPEREAAELADPALLPDRVARSRPDLLLLDCAEGGGGAGRPAAAAGHGSGAARPPA